jgi:hypothetical protein
MPSILTVRLGIIIFIALNFIFVPARGEGAEKGRDEPMKGELLFPAESGGWKWDGKIKNFDPRKLFDYIDGAAELYLAYRFQNLDVYQLEKSGQPPITIEIYRMGSSADAYGVFSFERQDEDAGLGQGSEFGGGMLRFWKGSYFVSIYGEGEGSELESAVLRLGEKVAQAIPGVGSPPKLIDNLPGAEAGLNQKTIRYLHSHVLLNQRFFVANQNILQLSLQTEAVLGQYLRRGQKVHLLLIQYSNSEKAESALQSFHKAYLPEARGRGFWQTEDRKWTLAKRYNQFILAVFGAPVLTDAEELIQATETKLREKKT